MNAGERLLLKERELLAKRAYKKKIINMLEMYAFIRASKSQAFFRAEEKIKQAVEDNELDEVPVDEGLKAKERVEQALIKAKVRAEESERKELQDKSYKKELPQNVSAIVFTFGSWLKGSGLKMKNLAGQEVGFTSCLIELSTALCNCVLTPNEVSSICKLVHFPDGKQCSDYSSPFKAQKIFKHIIKLAAEDKESARGYFKRHFKHKLEMTSAQIESATKEAE